MKTRFLTVAICTYNRSERLPLLITAIREQVCDIPFEVLIINNNSSDNTEVILERLATPQAPAMRFVTEEVQGIVPARNRAIEECRHSDYLFFMDDDELPLPGLLQAAVRTLELEGADCVGGRVRVHLHSEKRPKWLDDKLLGFLAEVNYGEEPFWIRDDSTPVWTANAAFRTNLFKNGLRFDLRYNRKGKDIGGGEDQVMFQTLLRDGAKIRYCPDMVVTHFVEDWRLKRRYFLKLHYRSGFKKGRWELNDTARRIMGIPLFLIWQAARHWWTTFCMYLHRKPGSLRQAMNGAHALGMIAGSWRSFLESCKG